MPYRTAARVEEPAELTACGKCEHFLDTDESSDTWHNHFCKARPTPLTFQYKTGTIARDSLADEYEPCRSVNVDGHCPHFQAKQKGLIFRG